MKNFGCLSCLNELKNSIIFYFKNCYCWEKPNTKGFVYKFKQD